MFDSIWKHFSISQRDFEYILNWSLIYLKPTSFFFRRKAEFKNLLSKCLLIITSNIEHVFDPIFPRGIQIFRIRRKTVYAWPRIHHQRDFE